MKTFNLYDVLKGFVGAETEEDAINKIKNGDWDEVIDENDGNFDEPVKGI